MSLADLAALPTAPTVSAALDEAAQHTDLGPFPALRRAIHGSTSYKDAALTVTPEHAIAEGAAIFVVAGLIAPEVRKVGPLDSDWNATTTAVAVGYAHGVLDTWAKAHTARQLAHLFEAAADRARTAEHRPA